MCSMSENIDLIKKPLSVIKLKVVRSKLPVSASALPGHDVMHMLSSAVQSFKCIFLSFESLTIMTKVTVISSRIKKNAC